MVFRILFGLSLAAFWWPPSHCRKTILRTMQMRDQWGMSNVLTVSLQATIYSLHDRGWSRRRIARELGIDRETVGRYLLLAKPAISTTGVEGTGEAKPAISTAGAKGTGEAKPAISTAGKGIGRKSQCEPLAEVIMAKVEVGFSAQRIYQSALDARGPAPRLWLNLPGSWRVCIPTCSMRSLKIRTQRLSQRTQTSRPISSGGAS
jgi:hypothetical protein